MFRKNTTKVHKNHDQVFKPTKEQLYYYVDYDESDQYGEHPIKTHYWITDFDRDMPDGDPIDRALYEAGNCFRTKKKAEMARFLKTRKVGITNT